MTAMQSAEAKGMCGEAGGGAQEHEPGGVEFEAEKKEEGDGREG